MDDESCAVVMLNCPATINSHFMALGDSRSPCPQVGRMDQCSKRMMDAALLSTCRRVMLARNRWLTSATGREQMWTNCSAVAAIGSLALLRTCVAPSLCRRITAGSIARPSPSTSCWMLCQGLQGAHDMKKEMLRGAPLAFFFASQGRRPSAPPAQNHVNSSPLHFNNNYNSRFWCMSQVLTIVYQ